MSKLIPVALGTRGEPYGLDWCEYVVIDVEDDVNVDELKELFEQILLRSVFEKDKNMIYDKNEYYSYGASTPDRIKIELDKNIEGIISVRHSERLMYIL